MNILIIKISSFVVIGIIIYFLLTRQTFKISYFVHPLKLEKYISIPTVAKVATVAKRRYIAPYNLENPTNELVIGCYNYKEPTLLTNNGGIKIFIESLRKFNKTCTIIVLMNTCPPEIKDLFNKNKVNCILGFKEELMYTRFIKYYQIINRYKSFNKILLCDLNDVIFQGNPFDIKLDTNKLYCAQEISSYDDLSNSSTLLNLQWIRDAHKFNIGLKNIYKKKYKNKNVICAGTILGNRDAILSYLIWYEKIQTKAVNLRNDQGLLNIYAYEYGENRVIVERYQDGQILTLDKMNFENIRKDSNGFLINSNGEKYCIIHQINRCGEENLKYLKDTILG